MKKLFNKAKSSLQDTQSQLPSVHGGRLQTRKQHDTPSITQPPTELDVLRYRYHHGTNLGGIFVLERWLWGSMFEEGAKGGSELDAVNASIAAQGIDATIRRWETHWSSALSDSDIDFLANTIHCTSIRIPIGYFTLGVDFTANTPFAGIPSQVYASARTALKSLCSRLHAAGIGVLLDLHALPGGANKDEHSGTSSGLADFWPQKSNLDLGTRCIQSLASEVSSESIRGCIGIQLCNEAAWGAPGMYDWYTSVGRSVSQIDPSIPLYISDAWDLNPALSWSMRQNSTSNSNSNGSPTNPIVVDTHKYYTFSEADRAQSPEQIIARIPSELDEVSSRSGNVLDRGAAQVIVGEWSCVLDGSTWANTSSNPTNPSPGPDRAALVRQFGTAQCQRWRERSAGAFFWTAKMDWMDGGEWGFFEMSKKGAVVPSQELTLAFEDVGEMAERAVKQWGELKERAASAHVEYWSQREGSFEHWRFEKGWDVGFGDALAFFGMRARGGIVGARSGADRIGGLEIWIRKRLLESGMGGPFVWEWEQGFRQGVGAFEDVVGLRV